jgi:dTDP-4-amino-4,6-dideoxygalactose transaminase
VEDPIPVPFVDLSDVNSLVRSAVEEEQAPLIDRGAFINGPAVERFEAAFARYCRTEHCVGVASGLDALRLGLIALELPPRSEVIVPAMTFIATFEAVEQAGLTPVPVDVNDDDCGLDAAAVDASVTSRTSAILPVHLYGQMADVSSLTSIATRRSLALIEDACQAHGAHRDGVSAGAVGTLAAFSFYPTKNLGAWGDAGALVTESSAMADKVRALREHGQTRRYHSEYLGYTARLDALQAVVLTHKLRYLDEANDKRRAAATQYSSLLRGVGDLRLPVAVDGSHHVWHLYTLRTAEPQDLGSYLDARGIGSGRHYPEPPHTTPPFGHLGYGNGAFPVAETIARETISLPMFPGISEEQVEAVATAVRSYFADGRRAG